MGEWMTGQLQIQYVDGRIQINCLPLLKLNSIALFVVNHFAKVHQLIDFITCRIRLSLIKSHTEGKISRYSLQKNKFSASHP
jgi:hypothetical protein